MEYWAKDGSYVEDEFKEGPITQAEQERRGKMADERRKRYEDKAKRQEEADRQLRQELRDDERRKAKEDARKSDEVYKKARDLEDEELEMRTGVPRFVRNAKNLDDRRARANYWNKFSMWSMVVGKVTGKTKKFEKLWDDYSHAETEEEKERIVEEMERLYPTTDARIKKAIKVEGRRL